MNPVYTAASSDVSLGWMLGIMTVLFLATFIGWALWAYAPRNADAFRRAARLPLDDEGTK